MSRPGSRLPLFLIGAAVLLILLLIVGLASSMEKVERTIRIPPGPEARRNPLLASERFLNEMGLVARSAAQLEVLPSTDQLLIIGMENRLLTQRQAQELVDWVTDGGYLIVGPHLDEGWTTDATWNDRLLDLLDIHVVELIDEGGRDRSTMEISVLDDGETSEVEFYSAFGVAYLDEEEEDTAYAFAWGYLGDGRYLVLNDLEFLQSDQIGKFDHAAFLWDLVQFGGPVREVQLIHGMEHASIWSLIGRYAWPLILGASLLVGAMAWRRAARFGPKIPVPEDGSRSLIDHVDGLGWFLWRRRRADALVDSARDALHRCMVARRPDFARGDQETQLRILSARSAIDPAAVYAAMFGERSQRRDEYTQTIRTLERLRREL